jgi:tRNA-dihydrouridine synthase B
MKQIPAGFSIGPIAVAPATVLAPMAGVTDTIFRQLIRNQGGCGLLMTEFTSSDGVVKAKGTRREIFQHRYLHFEDHERPISAQLFGADPEIMAGAAKVCEDLGFDSVDINFGCPVKKVVKCNGGSGLLRDLPLVDKLLKTVRAAIKIPLTCKFRSGWSDAEHVYLHMGRLAQENGLQAVALHARTREQGYSGMANWDHIAALKSHVKIPVIGNGDIVQPQDAVRMFHHTDCDAVMIGRGASYNPWIFRQIREFVETGSYFQPSEEDRFQLMRTYYTMMRARGEADTVGKMKQFATYFTHGVRNGSRLRVDIYKLHEADAIIECTDRFFERELSNPSQSSQSMETLVAEEAFVGECSVGLSVG